MIDIGLAFYLVGDGVHRPYDFLNCEHFFLFQRLFHFERHSRLQNETSTVPVAEERKTLMFPVCGVDRSFFLNLRLVPT